MEIWAKKTYNILLYVIPFKTKIDDIISCGFDVRIINRKLYNPLYSYMKKIDVK